MNPRPRLTLSDDPARLTAAFEAAVDRALAVVEQEARANPMATGLLRAHRARARAITRHALAAAVSHLAQSCDAGELGRLEILP